MLHLLPVLLLAALAVTAPAAAKVDYGQSIGVDSKVEYCRPYDIVWWGEGPINITVTRDQYSKNTPVVEYIATNTSTNVTWVVDMPVADNQSAYWVNLVDGTGTTLSFGLNTTRPANSSCDTSLLKLPVDEASLQPAAESAAARGAVGGTGGQLALLVGMLGLVSLA